MATRDRALTEAVKQTSPGVLHLATARAAARLYVAYARGPDGKLLYPERHQALREFLAHMRRDLAEKRALLAEALPEDGLGETVQAGGLFLAPRMTSWLGREVDGVKLTRENLPAVVYEHTHVVLNSGEWCGEPDRVRAVFSIPRETLEQARERLKAFARKLRG
ncbi:hypothetical protein STIAU_2672 [Stigmatella aurantiaca DW4/3-1]|nr:hypothetical protein STIAU_2672 [Stigmatella aurantiaca DW4/3-1]